MPRPDRRHLYLPARDRSFWRARDGDASPLLYLAWGTRDFQRQPIPASRHEGWVCVLVEEGSPILVVRRRSMPIAAGTVAIVGPDCPFGWCGAASATSKFRLWMWRSLSCAEQADLRASFFVRRLGRDARRPLLLLHDLCRGEVLRPSGPAPAYLEGCQMLLDETVQRAVLETAADASGNGDLVAIARSWIDAHLDSREPIARLCDYLNVSQSTLYRVFAAGEGISPLAYFHRTRMRRARELLDGRALSVKEVAHALGYEHASDLSRAYGRHFGVSPTQARHTGKP